jgi:hypothetical protein
VWSGDQFGCLASRLFLDFWWLANSLIFSEAASTKNFDNNDI